jgi:RNA polymerase sigma factor FliA
MANPALNKLKRYSQGSPPAGGVKNPAEREALILEYAPLVKTIAGRLGMRLPQHVSQDDLIGAGIMGLMDAVEKFNASKGVAFKSYAEFRIRGAMLDELRAMDWVPRSVRRNARKIEAAYARVENGTMRPASDEEVAQELGVDLETFYSLLEEARGVALISEEDLGHVLPNEPIERFSNGASDGKTSGNPSDSLDLAEVREVVAEAIDRLPKNERLVVALYYYEELTMREIGEIMNYTESRISQLHTKAILRLRGGLKGYFESESA